MNGLIITTIKEGMSCKCPFWHWCRAVIKRPTDPTVYYWNSLGIYTTRKNLSHLFKRSITNSWIWWIELIVWAHVMENRLISTTWRIKFESTPNYIEYWSILYWNEKSNETVIVHYIETWVKRMSSMLSFIPVTFAEIECVLYMFWGRVTCTNRRIMSVHLDPIGSNTGYLKSQYCGSQYYPGYAPCKSVRFYGFLKGVVYKLFNGQKYE